VTWIALPTATAALPGVAAWRGRAVAVADLAALLGAGERLTPPTGRVRTLYLQQGASTLAVPVDAVREPLTIADSDIRPPRARTESFCTGELDVEGHTTLVVDLVEEIRAPPGGRPVARLAPAHPMSESVAAPRLQHRSPCGSTVV